MRNSLFVLPILCAALSSFAAPNPAYLKAIQTVDNCRKDLDKRKAPYAEILESLENLRQTDQFATNLQASIYLDRQMLALCRTPNWVGVRRWDISLQTKYVPLVAKRNLENPSLPLSTKVFFAGELAEYLAGEKRFGEAEKIVSDLRASATKADAARLTLVLADVYRWQDRFEDAKREIRSAVEVLPAESAKAAIRLRDDVFAAEILARLKSSCERLSICREMKYETPQLRAEAYAFVASPQNRAEERASVAALWLIEDYLPQADFALQTLAKVDVSKAPIGHLVNKSLDSVFVRGDWRRVKLVADAFKGLKILSEPRQQRKIIVAMAGLGDRKGALGLVRANLECKDLKPLDAAKFRALEALLKGGDVEGVIREAKLARKDEIELVRTAARQALTLNIADEAEKLSAKFRSYFVDYPQREMKVAFNREGVPTITDWRKIASTLDRQVIDRKFGANLDILDTDVATGRQFVEKTERDSKDVSVEVSSVCDTKAIHFFLKFDDPNARQVEAGFAGGVGMEMYFSTGLYKPYVCFGSDPRAGVNSEFHTQYANKGYRRPKVKSETAFTDRDYVLHVWIDWEDLYWNLPKDGTRYRFEGLAFCPKGAFSLGGSEGVHNTSKWCDLVFSLKDEELTAIRRELLYRGVKSWRSVDHLRELDIFDKWSDAEVGDPEFYNTVLKPLERELVADAQRVKPEMSDDEVNAVFARSYVRWMGIRHEIDILRKNYLEERMCK